ncbi:MAG: MalY/PatB family protein [Pseudomonadota bacterium]
MFDFDTVIDRRHTHSSKWDAMPAPDGVEDAIPMWVADMDFKAAPVITDALAKLGSHGIFGYYGDDRSMREAVINWMTERHGWTPDPDWITHTHGLVSAVGLAIQAFTQPTDAIVVFSPVYHAFGRVIRANGRPIHEAELKLVQGRYEMDLDALAEELPSNARMVIFCSPHNPGGRVWSSEEIKSLAEFCVSRDLLLISDEVHHDLVFDGARHHVTMKAAPVISDNLITLTAPSKTFNIAGALTGQVTISNPKLRQKFQAAIGAAGVGSRNAFGMAAAEAAYRGGAPWLDALLPYLQANRDRLQQAVADHLPGARFMELPSTYLAWLDFRETGLTAEEARYKVENEARVVVNKGPTFGKGGDGWLRLNFACPRATLDAAIARLAQAFQEKAA